MGISKYNHTFKLFKYNHTFKLFKYFSRTDARKYFFTRRVVEPWNNLPQEVACAASVDDFKKLIDQYSSNTMYKCM